MVATDGVRVAANLAMIPTNVAMIAANGVSVVANVAMIAANGVRVVANVVMIAANVATSAADVPALPRAAIVLVVRHDGYRMACAYLRARAHGVPGAIPGGIGIVGDFLSAALPGSGGGAGFFTSLS
jgi:hypothetical protein